MSTIVTSSPNNTILHRNQYIPSDFNRSELIEEVKKVSSPDLKGTMSQWFFDGIRVSHSDLVYTNNNSVEWKGNLDAITLGFNLKGKIAIEQKDFKKSFSFSNYQHNAIYTGDYENIMRNEDLASEIFMIQFNKDAFLRLTENTTDNLMYFRDKILNGTPVMLSDRNALINPEIRAIINSVLNCPYSSSTKKLYFLSKCIELLVLQSQAFDKSRLKKQIYCKTNYDKERIIFAGEYLLKHYDSPPTLTDLAHTVGINEFKLKKGFKEIFGTTAFGYLTNYKMQIAKNKLSQKQITISRLAYELGYSSPQHFSTAFKNTFGYSPKYLK
ncbi:MAG TPA: AraC family transcriptional regulator [Mucilaginibacter sp.]|jgi:AraC-like DNA-binding protein